LFYEGEQGVVYSLGESADKRRPRWPIKAGSGEEKAEPKRQRHECDAEKIQQGKRADPKDKTAVKECN